MEKILIVDDSPIQADFLKSILRGDYDVSIANVAEEGLQCAKDGGFSLVLLDIVMPGMDGFVLLKKLQEEVVTKHTPVILITSLEDEESEERGLTLGAVDYIRKPFREAIVRARVNTHLKLHSYRAQIERQAMVDQLTGVANRRRYDVCCQSKWQDAIRLGAPISLCMFDIDNFKTYNDTFGHPAGDRVLAEVARTVNQLLRRSTDFFARYGGEEFVAILLGDEAKTAFQYVKKIRESVEERNIPHSHQVSKWVTVSVGGVTVCPQSGDSYETYLKIADTMLYDAKRFGRNQVVWSNEHMEQMREK
ncbi:MAG: diguanylate cyclase [Lawsonibacter sp.]|nr:diguanylate cyclase [Lawsonibacter sp.]